MWMDVCTRVVMLYLFMYVFVYVFVYVSTYIRCLVHNMSQSFSYHSDLFVFIKVINKYLNALFFIIVGVLFYLVPNILFLKC